MGQRSFGMDDAHEDSSKKGKEKTPPTKWTTKPQQMGRSRSTPMGREEKENDLKRVRTDSDSQYGKDNCTQEDTVQ